MGEINGWQLHRFVIASGNVGGAPGTVLYSPDCLIDPVRGCPRLSRSYRFRGVIRLAADIANFVERFRFTFTIANFLKDGQGLLIGIQSFGVVVELMVAEANFVETFGFTLAIAKLPKDRWGLLKGIDGFVVLIEMEVAEANVVERFGFTLAIADFPKDG